MRDLTMTEARNKLTSLPEALRHTHDAISITRRGKPVLAVLRWDEYESVLETLEVLGDPKLMAAMKTGIREIKRGKGISWDRAKAKIGL